MRVRVAGRWWWLGGVAAAGVAAAAGAWAARRQPPPDIPRPGPGALTERFVQQQLSGLALRVEANPRSAAAWGEYATLLRAYEQHPEADRCFQVAADLDPADGRWPYLLGARLLDTADPAAAVGWLERAAAGAVPPAARETVRVRLAEALVAAGRPADALAALGPDPADPRGRLVAARAAAAAGDDRAAAEHLHELADHPLAGRQALLLRADLCRRQGRTSYADLLAGRAADAPGGDWPDPLADPVKALNQSRVGRLEQAARLMQAGRPDEAEQVLLPLAAGPEATDPRAFLGLAEAREALGDRAGALDALGRGVKLDPTNVAVNYQTGLLHFKTGEALWSAGRQEQARAAFREAVGWLDKALAGQGEFGKALLLKGAALSRFLGRPADGLALLRRFVQLRPDVAEGHLLLGQALADGGQPEAAATALRRATELSPPGDRRAAEALAKLGPAGRR